MKRILFVSFSGPFPPVDGKRQRTFAVLNALSAKYVVDFLILGHKTDFEQAQANMKSDRIKFIFFDVPTNWKNRLLKKLGLVFFQSPVLMKQIKELHLERNYQFAFSRYIHPVIHLPSNLKVVADIDDEFEEIYRIRISQASSWYQKLRLFQVLKLNLVPYRKLVKRLSLGFTVKPEANLNDLKLLPNLPFQLLEKGHIPFFLSNSPSILFVGKLTFLPNLSGIKWFIREVFPFVLRDFPGVRLTIISNLSVEDNGFQKMLKNYPSIQFMTNVEDLIGIYHCHSVTIAPVFEGAGSNIKISESLWMGRPVVTTSFGSRGFEDVKGEPFFLEGVNPVNFSQQIFKLLTDKIELEKAQKEAYHYGQQKFSLNLWSKQFLEDIEHVG